jgi:hypothetical protein
MPLFIERKIHVNCLHVHDFIKGTTIVLPRGNVGQSVVGEGWDILHSNQEAAELVSRHVEALDALTLKRKRKVAAR